MFLCSLVFSIEVADLDLDVDSDILSAETVSVVTVECSVVIVKAVVPRDLTIIVFVG